MHLIIYVRIRTEFKNVSRREAEKVTLSWVDGPCFEGILCRESYLIFHPQQAT